MERTPQFTTGGHVSKLVNLNRETHEADRTLVATVMETADFGLLCLVDVHDVGLGLFPFLEAFSIVLPQHSHAVFDLD